MTEEEARLELEEQDAEVWSLEHAGAVADDYPLMQLTMNAQGAMASDANKTDETLHNRACSVTAFKHLDCSSLAMHLLRHDTCAGLFVSISFVGRTQKLC